MDIRQIVDRRRERLKMTQYRLAKEAGVHQQTISRFLRGDRDITTGILARLLAALGLQITVRRKRGNRGYEP